MATKARKTTLLLRVLKQVPCFYMFISLSVCVCVCLCLYLCVSRGKRMKIARSLIATFPSIRVHEIAPNVLK